MSNLNRHPVRRAAVGVLAGTLAFTGGAIAAGASPANAVEGFAFERLAGSDRYATAAAIAADTFPGGATTAIIARGDVFADALTANYLAGVIDAPILLTAPDDLPQATADSLTALGVTDVVIAGGTTAVSAAVEAELAEDYDVERLGGNDRYLTAELIAQNASAQAPVGDFNGLATAVLASGQDFPDALSLGPISYAGNHPLLITRPGDLPASTESLLNELGIEQVVIAGGPVAVSTAVENEVEGIVGNDAVRLGGQTRWETATIVAETAYADFGFDRTHVNLARGDSPLGFADALTGGPHAGLELAPIILTTPTSLQAAPRAFLEDNCATLTDGHIFGGPVAIAATVESDAEAAAASCGTADPTVTVESNDTTVEAGQPFVGTITAEGENITGVTVSGACVTDGAVTETGTAGGEEFGFSIPISSDAAAGACVLTFTVSLEGEDDVTVTQTITVERPASATTRPELTSASVVNFVAFGSGTPANPSGTTIRYTFDESVTAPAVGAAATGFHAYDTNRVEVDPTGTIAAKSGNSVDVLYNDIDTTAERDALTVATVDFQAVFDLQGQGSPEGDAPLGTTSGGGTTTLPAGITDAPDLVSVGNFRQAATAGETAVDFTFDQSAFVLNQTGFQLVMLTGPDGAAPNGTAGDNEVTCTGPAGGSTNASGGTVAGGNGTTTITVICTNPDGPDDGTGAGGATDPNITAAAVARGTVLPSTVESGPLTATAPAGVDNVLQAVDVSNGGNTGEPDLVSVELRPGATSTANDQALFTFDQPVNTADATRFSLYDFDANFEAGNAATVNPSNRTQVLVTFTTATADDAVGGYVVDNAVVTSAEPLALPPVPAKGNEQDEVGVSNTATSTGQTSGRTAAPDLTAVSLVRGPNDSFGNPGDWRAIYTFDEDVTVTDQTQFNLYLANGTQLIASACTVTAPASGQTADDVDHTVTCTAYTGGTGTAAEQNAQLGSATLGTVDNGAVTEETGAGLTNVEGAEFTTGGTGTRAA